MFLPKDSTVHGEIYRGIRREIYGAPTDEKGVSACRKVSCGTKKSTTQLNRTLPSLLDEGCDLSLVPVSERISFNSISFNALVASVSRWFSISKRPAITTSTATINHYNKGSWQSWMLKDLRRAAEELAIGLGQYSGIGNSEIKRGDRAALLMESDVPFVMADIGCLLSGLVTVPILPGQPPEMTEHMLVETEASVLFVSGIDRLKQLSTQLSKLSHLKLIVVASASKVLLEKQSANSSNNSSSNNFSSNNSSNLGDALENSLSDLRCSFPETVELITMKLLRQKAKWSPAKVESLKSAVSPKDLATIVYTLSPNGKPLGAMLTHENLSGSVLAAFGTLPCLRKGAHEVALSFLPLHHIFARGFVYGSLNYGQSLYFSSPRRVMKHLRELKPTVFFTVPRLLEKVYEGWESETFATRSAKRSEGRFALSDLKQHLKQYLKQKLMAWAWRLAKRYRLDDSQSWVYRSQLWVMRQIVFRPLRNLFGGRLQCFIAGGAALPAEVMTLLSAAGLKLCQGYGLTEASSTLCFTRGKWSRTETVGAPMPGVEIAIAPDSEVLVRAPYVMQGYYNNPEATAAVLEDAGEEGCWLHTGDLGEVGPDGLLTLTGQKKALFKLSIGEYVAPEPIEQRLVRSPLVKNALVVGPGRKFCGLLIVPEIDSLLAYAQQNELSTPPELLIKQPQIVAMYQSLVDQANVGLPFWSAVKRFVLVEAALDAASDTALFNQCSRNLRYSTFSQEIEQLYASDAHKRSKRKRLDPASASATALDTPPLTQVTSVS